MKKLMTTIGLGLIMATITPVMAQSDKQDNPKKNVQRSLTIEQKAQKRTDKMTEELGLSEEQAKKVYIVNLKHVKEMEAIHVEMKKLKSKAKSKRENTKNEMDKILTDEQKTKAEELHQKRKEKMKEKHKGQGPHGEGEHDKE
tara:strand:- start:4 stop:432 length:429 start_codon:yes stop_codon:yes gene_type:complete